MANARARQEAYEAYVVLNFSDVLKLHLFGKLTETQRLGSTLVCLYLQFAEVAIGAAINGNMHMDQFGKKFGKASINIVRSGLSRGYSITLSALASSVSGI